jgi:hypothetical protein
MTTKRYSLLKWLAEQHYDQVFVINFTETEAKSVINGDDIQC